MAKLFLFESGSTKTTLIVGTFNPDKSQSIEGLAEFTLSGYNPNRPSLAFLKELKEIEIQPKDHVYFYGSGLGADVRKAELKQVFKTNFSAEVDVYDDLLGAARALYGKNAGALAIMGTGGITAYYDGNKIQKRKGGYGYLIDDFGGGYELGKQIVSAWLNDALPEGLNKRLASHFNTSAENFLYDYYKNSDFSAQGEGLKKIADTVQLINPYKTDPFLQYLLQNYFDTFFIRHVVPLCNEANCQEIRLIGSLAVVFENEITEAAQELNLKIAITLRYPALKLFAFHQSELDLKNVNNE